MKRVAHPPLLQNRHRRGLSAIIVLTLLSITLALSYALVRLQTTNALLQDNGVRLQSAELAAEAGALLALRDMHQAGWSGVGTTIQGDLAPHQSFTASYQIGDPQLSPGDADYGEYPFRVTVDVTGLARDPSNPAIASRARIRLVVQLVRRRLADLPADWSSLQQFTVNQWSADDASVQLPFQVTGASRWQGRLRFNEAYPSDNAAENGYLTDLEAMRVAGHGDHRPFTGPLHASDRTDSSTVNKLTTTLGVAVVSAADDTTRPLAIPSGLQQYQLFPGGPLYDVPVLSASLSDVVLGPDVQSNPLGMFRSEGTLECWDNVDCSGTVLTDGLSEDLLLRGTGIQFRAVNLAPLHGDSTTRQLPTLLVGDDLRLDSGGTAHVDGLVVVDNRLEAGAGTQSTTLDMRGRVVTGQLVIAGRTSWVHNLDWWEQRWADFQAHLGGQPGDYFPAWLERNYDLWVEPRITFRPPAPAVQYHWPDWSQPIYLAHPDDSGLRWQVIRWGGL